MYFVMCRNNFSGLHVERNASKIDWKRCLYVGDDRRVHGDITAIKKTAANSLKTALGDHLIVCKEFLK